MFAVDTNVFLYAADKSYSEHIRCRKLLEKWRRQALPWCTTWAIFYEFLRVSTHPRVFSRPWAVREAWRFIEAVLASPGLSILEHTPRHSAVAAQTLAEVPALAGNILHDTHTAILMREHGVRRIYTRDSDFNRFPFLDVVDPLARR
jgi:hypothetical protein